MNILAAVLIAGVAVQAASLGEADIAAAIAEGAKLKQQMHKIGFTHRGAPGGYNLLVYGPLGRVSLHAAEAAAAFKPFTAADIPQGTLLPTLTVVAEPVAPSGGTISRPLRGLGLRAKGTQDIIPARELKREARAWSNALGGQFTGEAVTATFDLESLPPGDFEILTSGELGTGTVTIKAKDRAKIR